MRTRFTRPKGLCSGKECQGLNDRFSQKTACAGDMQSWIGMMIVPTRSGSESPSRHSFFEFSIGVLCSSTKRWI